MFLSGIARPFALESPRQGANVNCHGRKGLLKKSSHARNTVTIQGPVLIVLAPIPKGLRNRAQGSRAKLRGYLGKGVAAPRQPRRGLRNRLRMLDLCVSGNTKRACDVFRNPYRVVSVFPPRTQGSRAFCAATLGFVAVRLWRQWKDASMPHFNRPWKFTIGLGVAIGIGIGA